MSSYFTLPSYARAKKNQETLEKTNPQTPVLKDEDEKFLEKQMSKDDQAAGAEDVPPVKISDDGKATEATATEREEAGAGGEQVAIPETKPEAGDGASETKPEAVDGVGGKKKSKKSKGFELPSQEEAEKATQGWEANAADAKDGQPQGEKRTWASYIPSLPGVAKKDASADGDAKPETASPSTQDQRTWAQYASAYVPSSMPSVPDSWIPKFASKDKDAKAEPVYNEDGTINEEKTKEKQEKEVSVLLDNLNMSAINNRVFAFSGETQKIYERFAQVLRDTMNGGPTAYEDMEKLMRDAGPELEKQFKSMPPFVQTLVKSLPAKLGTTLGPELLAATSEKPGNDMKVQLEAANKKASGGGTTTPPAGGKAPAKSKRKIPGLKGLISQEGAIAGMLRNVVSFLRVRFPFLASTTNVVMSLAVFILMFVFWYCHKRGKEVRLAKTAAGEKGEEEDDEFDEEDEEEEDTDEGAEKEDDGEQPTDIAEGLAQATLDQPEPAEVPLPEKEKETS